MRHADAASPPATPDHDRPLTSSGELDAKAMGRWLCRNVSGVTAFVASDAARARRTAEVVRVGCPQLPQPQFSGDLYRASREDLIDLVYAADDDDVVLVIGHNPAIAEAAQALDPAAPLDFAPGAVAAFEVTSGHARLVAHVAP